MSRWDAFTRDEIKAIYGGVCTARPYVYFNPNHAPDGREQFDTIEALIAEMRPLDPLEQQ